MKNAEDFAHWVLRNPDATDGEIWEQFDKLSHNEKERFKRCLSFLDRRRLKQQEHTASNR